MSCRYLMQNASPRPPPPPCDSIAAGPWTIADIQLLEFNLVTPLRAFNGWKELLVSFDESAREEQFFSASTSANPGDFPTVNTKRRWRFLRRCWLVFSFADLLVNCLCLFAVAKRSFFRCHSKGDGL